MKFENIKDIEKKWQKRWNDAKIFEPKISKSEKYFITFPYPYVNLAPHIGHSFSAFRVDSYARFKRMQGYNVLYPQGFHATGEPILGVVERLRQGDPVQISALRLAGASETDIATFREKGPENVAQFWTQRWIEDLKKAGFSIDWSRTFITAITPTYNRFIEWQYNKLKKLGYVTQGTHPVIWCPHCKSPTGDHDRLEGEGESPIEYTLLKFKLTNNDNIKHESQIFLVAATLRPETIYGVTNIWVNPDAEYVMAEVKKDDKKDIWIIARQAIQKLVDQLYEVREIRSIPTEMLLGKRVVEPVGGRSIPVLPAHFVEAESATGIVMSVPAHAPYDWAGVNDIIQNSKELERYGVNSDELKTITIANTPGLESPPAEKICISMGIKSQNDRRLLDEATSIIYKREFHNGILLNNCGQYTGKKVSEVKEKIIEDFTRRDIASSMWETTGTVVCRCKTKNHVKILENQWFLRFSDPEWKSKVRKCLDGMKIYPDSVRQNFVSTIEWLRDKACARRSGLGTPLPFDRSWIVETLSDSTIYMAYYTIARVINREKIMAENMPDSLFDYIFLGLGDIRNVAKESNLTPKIINEMKDEFEYWYPVDMRNSGKDLIQHHLIFYIFHHTAIFPENKWPKGISVNGYVNVEGEKMSKSKGNIIPLSSLLEKFGSDMIRINIICDAENLDDANWRENNIRSYISRIELIAGLIENVRKSKKSRKRKNHIDRWIINEIQKIIKDSTIAYDELKFRTAVNYALFSSTNAFRWYIRRCENNQVNNNVLKKCLKDVVKLISPLVPHIAEELWEKLGNKNFIATDKWPRYEKEAIDAEADAMEAIVKKVMDDVEYISTKIIKRAPKHVRIFVAKTEKFHDKKQKKRQMKIILDSIPFFEKEMNCKFELIDGDLSDDPKSTKATPEKLGILIE